MTSLTNNSLSENGLFLPLPKQALCRDDPPPLITMPRSWKRGARGPYFPSVSPLGWRSSFCKLQLLHTHQTVDSIEHSNQRLTYNILTSEVYKNSYFLQNARSEVIVFSHYIQLTLEQCKG